MMLRNIPAPVVMFWCTFNTKSNSVAGVVGFTVRERSCTQEEGGPVQSDTAVADGVMGSSCSKSNAVEPNDGSAGVFVENEGHDEIY